MILDEPFSGLDPLAVDRMAADMRERAERGVPVLFSSHQLDLVERLCDDVIIIDRGTIVAAGDAEALRIRHGGRKLRVRGDAPNLRTVLAAVPGVSIAEQQSGGTYILDLDPTADDQAVLHAALAAGPLREFDPVEATLAQIFREAVAP
jgi:ABC-2 type transport system ATP-binding protein